MTTTNTCKNCGNQFTGKFCNACGEKVYHEKDKKVSSLFKEVLHFVTHFEGSFLTTFKTFITRPGKFSTDYCAGIRRKYFKPISFFLVLVVVYLFFPKFPGLNMHYYTYVSKDYRYSWYAAPIAKKKAKTADINNDEWLAAHYDKKSPAFAKVLLLTLIPLSAFLLMLLFLTSKRLFFDHFILATEILSFYLFLDFLVRPFLMFLVEKTIPSWSYIMESSGSSIFIAILNIAFTAVAFKRFYGQKNWIIFLKAVLFLFVFTLVILYVYYFLLYYLVMLFI